MLLDFLWQGVVGLCGLVWQGCVVVEVICDGSCRCYWVFVFYGDVVVVGRCIMVGCVQFRNWYCFMELGVF